MSICPNCKSECPDSSKFCSTCGTKLEFQAAPQQPAYAEPQYQAPQQPAYAEPQYQEPQQPAYANPQYQEPQQPAYANPQYQEPQQPAYANPQYQKPQQPAYANPQYQEPQQPAYANPQYQEPQQPSYSAGEQPNKIKTILGMAFAANACMIAFFTLINVFTLLDSRFGWSSISENCLIAILLSLPLSIVGFIFSSKQRSLNAEPAALTIVGKICGIVSWPLCGILFIFFCIYAAYL